MKILILANKPPYPTKDGSSLATMNMSIGLAETGNKVKVLAFSTQKHPCKVEQIPNEIKGLIDFEFVNINTSINPFKAIVNILFSKLPFNIERFIDKRFDQKLIEILKRDPFDIIQLEGLYLVPYINAIRKECNTPIVYRSHNIEHEIWKRIAQNEKNPLKVLYFKLLSRRISRMEEKVVQQVNALVAISKRDEQWFISRNFVKPSISIPSGYFGKLTPGLKGFTNNSICFLGSLDWIPNQEGLRWFIDHAWPLALSKNSNLELHIAGRNYSKALESYLNGKKGIFFHGEVEDSKQFLSHHRIMIVPLLSGSGMRVKIVEAMFLRLAVITTSIGCEGIDVTSGENIIIADSPDEFAQEIEVLTQSPELIDSISSNAFTFADENFNIAKLTERLITFYKNII